MADLKEIKAHLPYTPAQELHLSITHLPPPPPPKNFNTCSVLHFLYFFFELSPTPNKATGV